MKTNRMGSVTTFSVVSVVVIVSKRSGKQLGAEEVKWDGYGAISLLRISFFQCWAGKYSEWEGTEFQARLYSFETFLILRQHCTHFPSSSKSPNFGASMEGCALLPPLYSGALRQSRRWGVGV